MSVYIDGIEEINIPNGATPTNTCLSWGGELSINGVDNTKFDLEAGSGYVVDAYTDPQNPTFKKVTWTKKESQTVTNLGTQVVTYIGIDENGDVYQSAEPLQQDDMRDYISIGALSHPTLVAMSSATNFAIWEQDNLNLTIDFMNALGSLINVKENKFTYNGTNLKIDKNAGTVFGQGLNYKSDKKNPYNLSTSGLTAPTFISLYKNVTLQAAFVTDVPVTQYQPSGTGALATIPDNYYTAHRIYYDPSTNSIILQYGQYVYDSLKKATLSAEKDTYVEIDEIKGALLRCILVVKKNATDLSDRLQAKFINVGSIGKQGFSTIESYNHFVEPVEVVDGLSYQRQVMTLVLDTGVIYADVEATGTGDITYAFGQIEYILDCTTGSGVGGKARVALTAGSASAPQKNYIYVTKSGDVAQLNASTSEPTGEYSMVGTALLPDTTTFSNYGAYGSRRWSDAKQVDNRGVIANVLRKLRELQADYKSGLTPTITISTVPNPDSIDLSITSGTIREIYLQTTDALQLSVDGAYVVNDQTTAYTRVTDLNQITTDTTGGSLTSNNTYYQLVVAISTNHSGNTTMLINKPNGSYSNASDAFNDINGYSVTSFPDDFNTITLVCAVVLRYQSGGTYTNAATGFGVNYIDLRGLTFGTGASGSGAASVTEFSDGNFKIFDDVDNTKEAAFQVSEVTTGTTRTLTIPDLDGTIALTTRVPITTINTATYDITSTDYLLNCTYPTTAAITSLTLTTAETLNGRVLSVVDASGNAGSNTITIDTEGSQKINGQDAYVINSNYGYVNLYSDGSNWFIR